MSRSSLPAPAEGLQSGFLHVNPKAMALSGTKHNLRSLCASTMALLKAMCRVLHYQSKHKVHSHLMLVQVMDLLLQLQIVEPGLSLCALCWHAEGSTALLRWCPLHPVPRGTHWA